MEQKKELVDFILAESLHHNYSENTISAILDFVINVMILPKKEEVRFEKHIVENILEKEQKTILQLFSELKLDAPKIAMLMSLEKEYVTEVIRKQNLNN